MKTFRVTTHRIGGDRVFYLKCADYPRAYRLMCIFGIGKYNQPFLAQRSLIKEHTSTIDNSLRVYTDKEIMYVYYPSYLEKNAGNARAA